MKELLKYASGAAIGIVVTLVILSAEFNLQMQQNSD